MIVYKATNKVNGKSYIGQTIGYLSRRKYEHFYEAFKKKRNLYFHNAIRKYGKEKFTWEVLEKCSNQQQLFEMEFHYIKQFNTLRPNGYNLTLGYDNTTYGYKFTKEQKECLSRRSKGKNNPNYGNGDKIKGDKNPAKRIEVRKKISESKKGKKRPDFAEKRAGCYLIVELSTGKEQVIHNLAKWMRENPGYHLTGLKRVMSGKYKQHKGLWIARI